MKNEKSNLILSISFAIVFLITVGISYAYFSARISGLENASTISLEAGEMSIEYSENTNKIDLVGIYPKEKEWATKIITVTGKNTTNLYMKYELGLEVTTNDFKNSYIKYDLKLVEGTNGSPISDITLKNINGTGYKRFGTGYFANANNEVHKYELKIYFKPNGRDQNDAQKAVFNAKVKITTLESENPNEKRAMFLEGFAVNKIMKTLANLANGDETVVENQMTANTTITAIKESETEPISENKQGKNIVSVNSNDYSIPIYMWYEDGTIYWWSKDKHPLISSSLNNTGFFQALTNLVDISGLTNFDLSKAKNISNMFASDINLENINSIDKWNLSNVNNINYLFNNCAKLVDISSLVNWDVSNITNTKFLFDNSSLNNLNALKNWDVSNVANMENIFNKTKINNLSGLENWDTSKVESLFNAFSNNYNLLDISAISNWNVSNVTYMYGIFMWDSKINSISGLENWDVSNVNDFSNMFRGLSKLNSASNIDNWNIEPNANFAYMFLNTPVHPNFTKVQGTWNNGTFTPNP